MIHDKIALPINGSTASLTTYVMENSQEMDVNRRRPAMIICPGGGYEVTSDREAEPVAIKMLAFGYQVFVLHYSVQPATYPTALIQLAASVALVRKNSEEWFVNPEKIIVAGFSAGGHLAAHLGAAWQTEMIADYLEGPCERWRPNALLLSYPVISSGSFGHQDSFKNLLGENYQQAAADFSLENLVTSKTPPTFIWHTGEDGLVPAENSLLFTAALRKVQVPVELHLFTKGGHGLSLAVKETATGQPLYGIEKTVAVWPELFAKWFEELFNSK
ncbi:alpha/beta hydrolase [Enterococcus sp. LJL90]